MSWRRGKSPIWRIKSDALATNSSATGEALTASEKRFQDLFDEAPIAYVNEGLDSSSSAPIAPP